MNEVCVSKLSEVKTVFNSNADNLYYYDLLKKTGNYKIQNVELARPVLRQSDATIIWKTEANFELTPFKELPEDKQNEFAFKLGDFFNVFQEKINNLKNVPGNFAGQLIQIPNLNSLFVNTNENYIVVVNWGFLEDSFNRKSDVLQNIFARKSPSSILVKAVNKKSNPVEGIRLKLESNTQREYDTTDTNGLARLGTVEKGEDFSIYQIVGNEEKLLQHFKCDGRSEYLVEIEKQVKIGLKFVDPDKNPVAVNGFKLSSPGSETVNFDTDYNGSHSFVTDIEKGNFEIRNEHDNRVFLNEIPDSDTDFEIILEKEEDEIFPPPGIIEEPEPVNNNNGLTFRFINNFNRNIKGLPVSFEDPFHNKFSGITDNNGEIQFPGLENPQITLAFERYNTPWSQIINTDGADYHTVKVRSIFPWLWWLLMALLLFLLICCLFFDCFKADNVQAAVTTPVEEMTEEKIAQIEKEGLVLCNSQIESGGQGITEVRHYLGSEPGVVEITYNMRTIPDKLEVFYQGARVASTFNEANNIDGFVGEELQSGCCGILQFNYVPDQEEYCLIRVTGPEDTVWIYEITCPR